MRHRHELGQDRAPRLQRNGRRRHGPHPQQGEHLRPRRRPPRLRPQGRHDGAHEVHPRHPARPRQQGRQGQREDEVPRAHSGNSELQEARGELLREGDPALEGAEGVQVRRLDGLVGAGRRQHVPRSSRRQRPREGRGGLPPQVCPPRHHRQVHEAHDHVPHPEHHNLRRRPRRRRRNRRHPHRARHQAHRAGRPPRPPLHGLPRPPPLRPCPDRGRAPHALLHRARPLHPHLPRHRRGGNNDAHDRLPQRLRPPLHGRARLRRGRHGHLPDLARRLPRPHPHRLALHGQDEGQGPRGHPHPHPLHVQGAEARVRGVRGLHAQGRGGEDQGTLPGQGPRSQVNTRSKKDEALCLLTVLSFACA
mmetsp:Transcript_13394/g.24621  ORF Transcript_13394/g.24621 Transcript_13394/m.24621 type:complete len:363 (+) Transcript_13394:950-2038(+)